jgi:hypothetical protein
VNETLIFIWSELVILEIGQKREYIHLEKGDLKHKYSNIAILVALNGYVIQMQGPTEVRNVNMLLNFV